MLDFTTLKGITFGGVGVWTLVAMLIVAMIKVWPALKKIQSESDGSLRQDLLQRIESLEKKRNEDAAERAARIAELEQQRTEDRRECKDEQDKLHQRIREQEKVIDGLQRQLIMFQITVAEALPPDRRSPEILSMLKQLAPLMGRDEP